MITAAEPGLAGRLPSRAEGAPAWLPGARILRTSAGREVAVLFGSDLLAPLSDPEDVDGAAGLQTEPMAPEPLDGAGLLHGTPVDAVGTPDRIG